MVIIKLQTKKQKELAWLDFSCLEGHKNKDLIKCDGDKCLNPIWGIYCSNCGMVTEVNTKIGLVTCSGCGKLIEFDLT